MGAQSLTVIPIVTAVGGPAQGAPGPARQKWQLRLDQLEKAVPFGAVGKPVGEDCRLRDSAVPAEHDGEAHLHPPTKDGSAKTSVISGPYDFQPAVRGGLTTPIDAHRSRSALRTSLRSRAASSMEVP